jgi:hypothetical protein
VAVAAARREFEKARREAAPATIVEAAKDWLAAADHPRFLIRLDKWLATRCWQKKPPEKRHAVHRRSPHHVNGEHVNIGSVMAGLKR